MLGIQYPIFQGGMAWVADAKLAAGVSNAGGLGIIAAMNSNGEQLRSEIKKCKELTDKPFGVNVMLMSPYVDEAAQVVCEEGVKVVTTGAGNPTKYMKLWNEHNISVIPVVPSTGLAKIAERAGAAAVIAEGGESGGHIGELTTMALVPQVVNAVNIPVIAAGGIGDGRGVAAAFMLGAIGVQLGTRFLVTDECSISDVYKEKVLKAKDIDTIITGKRLGHPVRSIKTPLTRKMFKAEYDANVSNDELEAMGVGSLRKAVKEGNLDEGTFLAGQISGMINKKETCESLIKEIFSEAEEVLKGAEKWVK